MTRTVILLFAVLFFTGCNEEENELLKLPPYKVITDSISQEPKRADLYHRRGSLLYSNQLPDLAEKDLRKAWELQPAEQYAISLSIAIRQRSVDEAIRFLEDALKQLPNSVFVRIQLIQGYRSRGETGKALALIEEVIAAFPNNIDVYLIKSEILKDQDQTEESIAAMEQAYRYAPGDVELVHNLAFAYAEARDPKVLALSDSLIAADAARSRAEPYFFKGVYYSNTGDYGKAIEQFNQAITTQHNFIDAYINKGIVYYDQRKFKDALEVFQLANRISPDDAYPYYWMAKTQQKMGAAEEAKLNYQRAYQLDKTMTNAKDSANKL